MTEASICWLLQGARYSLENFKSDLQVKYFKEFAPRAESEQDAIDLSNPFMAAKDI